MKKGFTLLELLIVIGIMAVLVTAATIVLNPAELLKQARDAQRLSDLDAIKTAIALHLATAASPDVNFGLIGLVVKCTVATTSPFTGTGNGCGSGLATSSRVVTGGGWVAVNLTDVAGGVAPLGVLPIDPVANNADYQYAYAGNDTTNVFEINTRMESTKYGSGTMNKMLNVNDGGSNDNWYEVGTSLTL
ncbi:MAG: type II secretion system protein [Patescibacteria group bacterium]